MNTVFLALKSVTLETRKETTHVHHQILSHTRCDINNI